MLVLITEQQYDQIVDKYYHGSSIDLNVGDYILPPNETLKLSEKGRKKNLDKIFLTKDFGLAKIYAGRAKNSFNSNMKFVYIVQPIGEFNVMKTDAGASIYIADKGLILDKIGVK